MLPPKLEITMFIVINIKMAKAIYLTMIIGLAMAVVYLIVSLTELID